LQTIFLIHCSLGVTVTEIDELVRDIYDNGIAGLPGAFSRSWVQQLGEDVDAAFADALARPAGAVGRGPQRYYVEIHPEQLRGFVDLATHPSITAVCEAVLGFDYRIVEVGFDVPLPGAVDQPWHRDFPSADDTLDEGRLTSLAINATTVDTEADMGPFEIAPGTHWDDGAEFEHGMFPPKSDYPRYRSRAQRKYPRMGDISIRSALTIHRGTTNHPTSSGTHCPPHSRLTWPAPSSRRWYRSPRSTPSKVWSWATHEESSPDVSDGLGGNGRAVRARLVPVLGDRALSVTRKRRGSAMAARRTSFGRVLLCSAGYDR
jgi:hypothetical protein